MQACLSLNIAPHQDFISVGDDYKFTRFACYLIAMNADSKKPQVAMVQVYLSSFANSLLDHREQAEIVDRVRMREDMRDGMRALSETAQQHGVLYYGSFMDAGYRGMYNMRLSEIEKLKGVPPGQHLLDRMGRTELAANYLRVTLTDDRIRVDDVYGQAALEQAAYDVGQIVRDTVYKGSGRHPEDMPLAEHISESKKTLKAAGQNLKNIGIDEAGDEIMFLAATTSSQPDPGYTKDPEEDELTVDSEPPRSH
jgi:DNA-damage-inducible protein D